MLTLLFLSILVASPWLIMLSWLLKYKLKVQDYDYTIFDKKTLYNHLRYVLFMVLFGFYIFGIRLYRLHYQIDYVILWEKLEYFFMVLPKGLILIFGVFIFLLIRVSSLFFRLWYKNFNNSLLSLYLYLIQYKKFNDLCSKMVNVQTKDTFLLCDLVKLFTKHKFAISLSLYLWPGYRNRIEKLLFIYLIPYLVLYDMILYYGVVSKIFFLMPWYYIYSILRAINYKFCKFYTAKNAEISRTLYYKIRF